MRCNANINAPNNTKYTYKCESTIFPGWRIVNKNFEDQEKIYNFMQKIKNDQVLEFEKIMYIYRNQNHTIVKHH